jgi:REP element-mobilizing transposase RayT
MRRGVWNLRSQRCFGPISEALRKLQRREGFRVVHFSVQGNHLHLVTEADDRAAMSNGMRALLIRIARKLNRLMGTRGRLYADRFHERALTSSRAVFNVVRYVLENHSKHLQQIGKLAPPVSDPFSSGNRTLDDREHGPPWSPPESWLLRVGWRRLAASI